MALQLREMGFKNVSCLEGGYRAWAKANLPLEKKWTIRQECVTCHTDVTPGIVTDWNLSKHSQNGVSCSVCHGEHHMTEDDVEKVVPMNPERCIMCHQVRGDQFKAGKHSLAWRAMKAMPTAHWQPMALMEGMKGCGGCHKIGIKSDQDLKELKEGGAGFGRASCDACHTRHTFSVKEARQPQACQTCHMGFDHPQWEMYSTSKHGVRFLLKQTGVLPETTPAPTCQTCHMQEGNHEVRTGWGFLAVRLPMPEDEKWAKARTTILQALGILDPEGKPTERLDLVKAADLARLTEEAWANERVKMLKTCNQCHSLTFAKGELGKGDQMIREADLVLAEGIRIVAGLYKEGILRKPENYKQAFPDFLTFHDAPRTIEQRLWLMFMKHRMRAFQGTFHANPDYAVWYGWSEMQQDLTAIREGAEDLRRVKR
ncbi:MAG: cytochrome C [Desulfobacterales bacterium]|nr:cytochrome C [Desulfobacterales bacterium]